MAKRRFAWRRRLQLEFDVTHAYQRHHGSTTQREDVAADLGMDIAAFRALLDKARRQGFDIEAMLDNV